MFTYTDNIEMISGKRMLLTCEEEGIAAVDWVQKHRMEVVDFLSVNGALLIRGLKISVEEFGIILPILFGEALAEYTYRSTPRKAVQSNIYTASEYHPSEEIPQHNENSY